jgi:sec-independent protein translocase protein TatA
MELFTPGHLLVLAIVALVLFFGWKQLPDMSRSLGRSLRIFKTEIKGMAEDDSARSSARTEPAALPEVAPPATGATASGATAAPAVPVEPTVHQEPTTRTPGTGQ